MGKACWKTWALAFLCKVSLVIEHVPQRYLEAKFTGCKKKWFLLFNRFPYPRVVAHTHVVLSLINDGAPWSRFSEVAPSFPPLPKKEYLQQHVAGVEQLCCYPSHNRPWLQCTFQIVEELGPKKNNLHQLTSYHFKQ